MKFRKIAVLTSRQSWFFPYAKQFIIILKRKGYNAALFFNPKKISDDFTVVFMLSYFKIVNKSFLHKHRHNLVVHESNLPKGKGWAPLFWQILKKINKVPIVLFEAKKEADSGLIYLKDYIFLNGCELRDEIRKKQAKKTIKLCSRFLSEYKTLRPKRQIGKSTFYRRRTLDDNRLNLDKTLREQFNLLRISNNKDFPAFFYYKGHKYILHIHGAKNNHLKCI